MWFGLTFRVFGFFFLLVGCCTPPPHVILHEVAAYRKSTRSLHQQYCGIWSTPAMCKWLGIALAAKIPNNSETTWQPVSCVAGHFSVTITPRIRLMWAHAHVCSRTALHAVLTFHLSSLSSGVHRRQRRHGDFPGGARSQHRPARQRGLAPPSRCFLLWIPRHSSVSADACEAVFSESASRFFRSSSFTSFFSVLFIQ